ncbi:hypothetical protein VA596_47890 [Amycolatopsis sp., V23-08]|uniref:Secreted protein n=1 Tax=Amycolatopsis heterodermiae TaxID=3110235 RepID=A0ABU5RP12_9PSEU|nr:hypothetical protein [Amycolatopsis sp., V23-08]MEA5367324.1 hypothetical protein [Amycolatopsis sp., V23-08]
MTARLKQLLVVLLILLGTATGATSWDAPVAAAGASASTQDTASERHAVLRVAATAPQLSAPAPNTWWAVHPPSLESSAPQRAGRVLDAPGTRSAVSLPTAQSTRAPPAR